MPIFTFSNVVRALKSRLVWKVRGDPETIHAVGLATDDLGRSAVSAAEGDRSPLWVVDAGQAVEQAGLAGAVRTDDREEFAPRLADGHLDEGPHPAEAQGDVLDVDDDVAGDRRRWRFDRHRHDTGAWELLIASAVPTPCSARPISRLRRRDGIIPSGRKIIVSTRIAPR